MNTTEMQVGRVLRVGRGWADVEVDNRVRRVMMRQDLLVRAGSYLKILNERGIAILSSSERHQSNRMH